MTAPGVHDPSGKAPCVLHPVCLVAGEGANGELAGARARSARNTAALAWGADVGSLADGAAGAEATAVGVGDTEVPAGGNDAVGGGGAGAAGGGLLPAHAATTAATTARTAMRNLMRPTIPDFGGRLRSAASRRQASQDDVLHDLRCGEVICIRVQP
jgi:hypothetical protein